MLGNQSGAITLDFIFAFVLVLSMTLLLGAFSFTLSIVEGVQYLTFSSSRAYYAGNLSPQDQINAGQAKFNELAATGSFKKLLKRDWFRVDIDTIGDSHEQYNSSDEKDIFDGVRTKITVGLLEMNIPIFGSTEGENPMVAYLTSFLGRESTTQECMEVVSDRYKEILNLGSYRGNNVIESAYYAFDDNGC